MDDKKRYYRVETETGIVRTVTDSFPHEYIQNSPYICTMLHCTYIEFKEQYATMWPESANKDYNLHHYFTPTETDSNFCARCGRYFTHKVHYRLNAKIAL